MSRGILKVLAAFALAGVTTAIAIGADRVGAAADRLATGVQPVPIVESAVDRPRESIEAENAHQHLWMEVTAYCPCHKCCGPQAAGVTASGLPVSHNRGQFVAADTSVLPFGSLVRIPGYHAAASVPVIDRGGAIKGSRIDVYFPTHEEALEWGRQWLLVIVVE